MASVLFALGTRLQVEYQEDGSVQMDVPGDEKVLLSAAEFAQLVALYEAFNGSLEKRTTVLSPV